MPLVFDKSLGLYKDGNLTLSREEVRAEIERIVRYVKRQSGFLSRALMRQEISLVDWQIGMRDLIKSAHVLSGAIGYGGFEQMTAARWGAIGGRLRVEYGYLNNFAREIEQGRVILESRLVNRAGLYAASIRQQYFAGEKAVASASGNTECRRILHALESCSGCVFWASRDFVPIDTQPPIGSLKCGQYCRCTLEYR